MVLDANTIMWAFLLGYALEHCKTYEKYWAEKTEDGKILFKYERNHVSYGNDIERKVDILEHYPNFNMFIEEGWAVGSPSK